MEKSKVYFTDLKTAPNNNLLQKLESLIKTAGIEKIDFKKKFTAIKIHFGEPGNLAYIRPNYVKKVADVIKQLGGSVYLTDANTLYVGKRSNAVDHLQAAMENGFNPLSTGCNVIIADGLKGTDYREIPIDRKHCKTAKIATGVADADVIISMNHFKGHEMTGFGGAIKNIGMGSGSRGGKLEMHSSSKPEIQQSNCVSCALCIKYCSQRAITFNSSKKAQIDYNKCIGCGQCVAVCQDNAAQVDFNENLDIMNEKVAEYTYAVLKDKPSFHINFIMNISPNCDCWPNNDIAVVPDIGIAASFDPVALDKASVDLVNQAPVMKGSAVDKPECTCSGHEFDKFKHVHPNTNWISALQHAETLNLGSMNYELVRVK
ncbi:MAG: DUF362 domain-containing protein [Clostridia bacterium]|nr:DUF362 domain-containing protein [Clostridia bacterium]